MLLKVRIGNAADAETEQVGSKSTSPGHMLLILGCNEEQRAQLCSGSSQVQDITNEVTTQERTKRLLPQYTVVAKSAFLVSFSWNHGLGLDCFFF